MYIRWNTMLSAYIYRLSIQSGLDSGFSAESNNINVLALNKQHEQRASSYEQPHIAHHYTFEVNIRSLLQLVGCLKKPDRRYTVVLQSKRDSSELKNSYLLHVLVRIPPSRNVPHALFDLLDAVHWFIVHAFGHFYSDRSGVVLRGYSLCTYIKLQ